MECILIEFNEVVPDSLEGERLDRLIAFIGNISRSEASNIIKKGQVLINDQAVTRSSFKVSIGNSVEFYVRDDEEATEIEADSSVDFKIIQENCSKKSRAYKLAKKAYKKYKKGTRRVKQVKIGGRRRKTRRN